MMCPTHGAVIIGPPCMRCVGEDALRECAEFAAQVRRLGLATEPVDSGAEPPPPAHEDPDP